MKKLKKLQVPKIVEHYELGDWKVTIVEENDTVYNEPTYEFYLTADYITDYMFGAPKSMLEVTGLTLEELAINNLPQSIISFKERFDECDTLENPFEEE